MARAAEDMGAGDCWLSVAGWLRGASCEAVMLLRMTLDPGQLPDDVATLKAMLLSRDAEIESLKLTIAKMQRDRFGAKSERGSKLLDQLELQLAEMEEGVAQDKVTAELTGGSEWPAQHTAAMLTKDKPARRPLPGHLPRERVVHEGPNDCPSCGGQLRKLGEDITETLEYVPATWKVIQHVREKFTCRQCEKIAQVPAPDHPIARHGEAVLRTDAAPDRICWRKCCSTNTAPTCRSTGKARSMPAMASTSTPQRWPTGSAHRQRR